MKNVLGNIDFYCWLAALSKLSQMSILHLHSIFIPTSSFLIKIHRYFFIESAFLENKAVDCDSCCVLSYCISIAGMVALWWEHTLFYKLYWETKPISTKPKITTTTKMKILEFHSMWLFSTKLSVMCFLGVLFFLLENKFGVLSL